MRILCAGHTYTIKANHAQLASLARLEGHTVALMTPDCWQGPLYKNAADHYELDPPIEHFRLCAIGIGKESAFLYRENLEKIIRNFQPDVIHVQEGAYAVSFAQILRAALKAAPEARTSFFTWWNLAYKLTGIKAKLQRHNFRLSSGAIAGNHDAKEILRAQGFSGPILISPQLGVDPEVFAPAKIRPTTVTIGYFGRIEKEKGVIELSRALSLLKNVNFRILIVGSGSASKDVLGLLDASKVDFELVPAVRNEEIPGFISKLDILVLPSRTSASWKEQFGHILIEAMSAQVAVIGSDSGEIPNVIADAGLVVQEGNLSALAEAVKSLIGSQERREMFGARGRARVLKHFTHDAIALRQSEFYRDLVISAPSLKQLASERSLPI